MYIYICIYIYNLIPTNYQSALNNTPAISSERAWICLAMLWHQVLDGKKLSNQSRLKLYIFTIKIMTNRNEK